ncbi:MAG TPA: hypothetical protein VFE62_21110 [Gemmataceae bacterium]|nr:hypothetical protein [Gemmataceae bacterium]
MTQNIPCPTQIRNDRQNQNARQRRLPTRIEAHIMLRDMAFVLKMTERVRNEIIADASSDDLAATMK